MMLHQRNRHRTAADDDDPTTPVFSSASHGSSNGGGSSPYVGYGGMNSITSGSATAGSSYSYGGFSKSAVSGGFKDKGKRKKQNVILQKLQDPLFLVSCVAILFFMIAVRYKLAHQHAAKPKNDESIYAISRQKEDLERELRTMRETYKKQMKENARLQADLMKLTKKSPDAVAEKAKLEAREAAWKSQFDVLRKAVQKESRRSLVEKYGLGPYFCEFSVVIPDDENHEFRTFTVEMAPLDLMPHAVHLFLEQVSHNLWDDAWFYLNGPHVLQAGPQAEHSEENEIAMHNGVEERDIALKPFRALQLDTMAFPEYSEAYPHLPWTLGFTGRPGGPDFYINKVDNTKTHGPGGQAHHDLVENADPCFAKVIHGMETLERMTKSRTIQEHSEYRFFFDEPIEIIRVRVVPDPRKPKVEEKPPPLQVETAEQHHEDPHQKIVVAPDSQFDHPKVEITHGDVVKNQQKHDESDMERQQMHRHRKHPDAHFLPHDSVDP